LVGLIIMTVANVCAGILFLFQTTVSGILSIFVLLVFIAGFEASIGCLFWTLLTEVFPPRVRDAGASLMNATQWSFNILLALFFLPLTELIGQAAVFWIFAGFGVFCTVFLYFNLPDTDSEE
jgi:MFS family permease